VSIPLDCFDPIERASLTSLHFLSLFLLVFERRCANSTVDICEHFSANIISIATMFLVLFFVCFSRLRTMFVCYSYVSIEVVSPSAALPHHKRWTRREAWLHRLPPFCLLSPLVWGPVIGNMLSFFPNPESFDPAPRLLARSLSSGPARVLHALVKIMPPHLLKAAVYSLYARLHPFEAKLSSSRT
jgi:hypothetical protein